MELLTIEEVAARLKVSVSTVRGLIRDGEFPEPIHPTDGSSAWFLMDADAYLHRRTQAHRFRKVDPKMKKSDPVPDEF